MIWWKKNHQQIWEPPDGIIFQYSSHQGLRWGDVSRLTWDSREFSRLRGHWEKGLGFFGWDENSLNMWVFTGLQLSSTDNFCLKLPSKLVSKVILKQKKHQLFYTFQGSLSSPQKCRFAKVFIKNSWKPLRSEPFRPLHWIHPLDIHGQSATSELPAWSMEIPRPPVGNAAVDLIQWVGFSRFETMKK